MIQKQGMQACRAQTLLGGKSNNVAKCKHFMGPYNMKKRSASQLGIWEIFNGGESIS